MSTVQSIYYLLQYRPDLNVNSDVLIPIVNAAVRAVANRLYMLDSSLVAGQLEVDISTTVITATSTGYSFFPPTDLQNGHRG
jgi:hypothetical protein